MATLPTRQYVELDTDIPPALARSTTAPNPSFPRSHLAPDDAPPAIDGSPALRQRRRRRRENGLSDGHGRKRRNWKKLLWVDRAYPDNYTDQATFLEQLQRNPRLQPYDFWPLVADTTVIVQQVCSVIIFSVSFVGIFQERVSHVTVVSCGSGLTFLGWLLWEQWAAEEEVREERQIAAGHAPPITRGGGGGGSRRRAGSMRRRATLMRDAALPAAGLGLLDGLPAAGSTTEEGADAVSSRGQASSALAPSGAQPGTVAASAASSAATASRDRDQDQERPRTGLPTTIPELPAPPTLTSNRMHQRLSTLKSAVLISSILLGLSPILKSLTRSTSSDSIWAMCLCLLLTNIISFDYSSSGPNVPASLSTNAALMASTVLASRLPSTGQVFSLTVLSIEVFGLFPVLRRYTRDRRRWHLTLTSLLVLAAGGGTGMVVGSGLAAPTLRNCVLGMGIGAVVAALAMGGCSWWLIGLQKYKNEINGPWDAARPIIISRRYHG
ncbi:related to pig-c protein [Cephalotrichum gorgonifer]|uniref:Related to pig-c protein n=1 Tax=Cephalotrichum gorgonifer TaxID=2041049 RepID=A0AAE8SWR2_9PEZI|nr:related to pig-c protein [Cephalotrichum gorgonifer]